MFTFFTKKILNKLRNRSYFFTYTADGTISSEGAWRITITNIGNDNAVLTDSAGGKCTIIAPPLNLESIVTHLILSGEPYAVRDDIIKLEFDGIGDNPMICVVFDRMVSKKETNNYPQDILMDEG